MAHSLPRIWWAICLLGPFSGCAALGPLSPLAPLERSLVYYPVPYPTGNWQPEDLPYEDAWFQSEDGTQLHGWFVSHSSPRAVALLFHGNAGNITSRASVLRELNQKHALAVMTFDYRGYGRSDGRPHERGILEDARAARAWLAHRTGTAEHNIVLFGRSLGGGVAVDLAAKDGACGLVLASTFTSLPDVGGHHVRWLPVRWMMANRLDSLGKIGSYHGPLLQTHGDADRVVPYKLGQQLHDAAAGPKQFITMAGAGHNDAWNEEFHTALDQFLLDLPTSNPPSEVTAQPVRRLPAPDRVY